MSISEATDTRQANISRPALTIQQILGAPLDQLIDHQQAQVVDIHCIDDGRFYGQVFVKRSGAIILAMPAGRNPVERDVAIRMLIAHLHGLTSDLWPAHMTTTDVIENGKDVL